MRTVRSCLGVAAGMLLSVACGGGGDGPALPQLIASDPAPNAVSVAPDTLVRLTFGQSLVPATVTPDVFDLRGPSGRVPAALSYDDGLRRVTLAPHEPLVLGAAYTALVAPGLTDVEGHVLAEPYWIPFRVRAGAFQGAQLLETEAVDSANLISLATNADGRGFCVWLQTAAGGSRTLHALPYDLATGPGLPVALATSVGIGLTRATVAVNAVGDAVVAWYVDATPDHAFARVYRSALATWTPTQPLESPTTEDARAAAVAIADNGVAIVVWGQEAGFAQPDDFWLRRYDPATGWTAPAHVEAAPGDAGGAVVATNARGEACIVWSQQATTTYDVWARRMDAFGSLASAEQLEADDAGNAFWPVVALDAAGAIVACWKQDDDWPHGDERMFANRFVPGSGWQGAELLQDGVGETQFFDLAMDAEGNTLVVWQQREGGADRLYARRHVVGVGWRPVATVSGANTMAMDANSVDLAPAPNGRAVLVWPQQTSGGAADFKDVFASRFAPATGWTPPVALDVTPLGFLPDPRVAMDPEGGVLAVWEHEVYDASSTWLRNDVWSNRYVPGLGWQGAALVEADEVNACLQPQVVMDRFGRGVVAWDKRRGATSLTDLYYNPSR